MKRLLRKPFAILLLVSFMPCSRLASQSPITNLGKVPTPQAADIGRFGDIPMSYYTGRANITIPIHSFTERGVTLDINLTYDTSGLPMNKLPGWVGAGWTLNAGGCITRVQRNFCDEMSFPHHGEFNYVNYFHAYSDLVDCNGNFDSTMVLNPSNYGHKDYAPDIFYFNFLGKTGRFFLGNDGEWKVSSDDNLVVEFDVNNQANYILPVFQHFSTGGIQPKTIKGFTLYDDDGNKYIFGGDTLSIEYTMDLYCTVQNQDMVPWVASSWYLTRIEDRLGNLLYEFNYERGKYLVQMFPPSTTTSGYSATLNLPVYLTDIITRQGWQASFSMTRPYTAGQASRNLYPSLYSGNTALSLLQGGANMDVTPLPFYYLQNAQDQHARFYSATNQLCPLDPLSAMDIKRLSSVNIRMGLSQADVSYIFNYDNSGRYHLSSLLTKTGTDTLSTYTFDYNSYASVPSDYLTTQHDSWGNYNGPTGSWIPNETYAKKGMLTTITYPTGGRSTFEYELNDYSVAMHLNRTDTVHRPGTACGLRVKSIKDYDAGSQTPLRQRLFTYTNPSTGLSSGQYFADPDDDTYYLIAWGRTLDSGNPDPVIPLATTLRTCVGYSMVTETVEDVGNHLYNYSNFANVGYAPPSNGIMPYQNEIGVGDIMEPYSRRDFMRGKLMAEFIKDSENNICKTIRYEYRTDGAAYNRQLVYGFDKNFNMGGNEGCYTLYYPKYDLKRVYTETQQSNGLTKDTLIYMMTEYSDSIGNLQPPRFRKCTRETIARADSRMEKQYTYQSLAAYKYFIPLVSTSTSYNGSLMQTEATQYALFSNKYLPKYETTQLESGPVDTLVTYHTYSSKGHPLTFTRKGEHMTTMYWNTSKDRLLASLTYPSSTASQVTPNTQAQTPDLVLGVGSQSIFSFPEVRATTYVYDQKGRVVSSATGNGLVTYYSYDSLGRLTEIQDANGNTLQRFSYHYSTGN